MSKKIIKITESQLKNILNEMMETSSKLEKKQIKESFWSSVFGKPTVKDAAISQYKGTGHSHVGKEENYLVYNGQKYYPEQIEYADYQDTGEIPRVENGKLLIANPVWSL